MFFCFFFISVAPQSVSAKMFLLHAFFLLLKLFFFELKLTKLTKKTHKHTQDFRPLRQQAMRGKDGYIMVGSYIDSNTLTELGNLHDDLEEICMDENDNNMRPIILAINKCDLSSVNTFFSLFFFSFF